MVPTTQTGTRPLVRGIFTRTCPNLEVGCFAAMIEFFPKLREILNITDKPLVWRFYSPAEITDAIRRKAPTHEAVQQLKESFAKDGIAFFNVGKALSDWDQHGRTDKNGKPNTFCSLDLALWEVSKKGLLTESGIVQAIEVWNAVRKNDLHGTRIARSRFNLRELGTGVFVATKHNQTTLEFLKLGFCSVFCNLRNGVSIRDAFSPQWLKRGVAEHDPSRQSWFDSMVDDAIKTLKAEWENAKIAVAAPKYQQRVKHPKLSTRPLTVALVESDSCKAGAAARRSGIDICIVKTSTDNHQIYTRNIFEYESGNETTDKPRIKKRWRIKCGHIIHWLRLREARARGLRLGKGYYTDIGFTTVGQVVLPWYLPEFETAVFNGTLSTPEVEPSALDPEEIWDAVIRSLPHCDLIYLDEEEDEWIEVQ